MNISNAIKKYGLNRNTLMSWVKSGKISAEKVMTGQKPIYELNEESLELYLANRSPSKTSNAQVGNLEESGKRTDDSRDAPSGTMAESSSPETPPKEGEKPRGRRKSPLDYAKDAMRKSSPDDLRRLIEWSEQRLYRIWEESRQSPTGLMV